MKNKIYKAIYRLFEEGDYSLTITVGSVELSLYDPINDYPTIWERGIMANGEMLDFDDLYGVLRRQ